ncbi:hypothetical protein GCFR_00446 [Citrobacter freundii ATCC 8090 = MTCC 1658 = NBRC 12681]|uniref:hypothetical protein n=1 Tax=Citrobacter freundii TaxID=546 RepID=UPI000299C2A0|nr:hypothetical protein [Citrobacter freundii]EKS57414.1 hypothetical protein D186_08301 [Citrobacter freundii ATCC 8090 = MTCC 1658 = NBRC 12681]EXF32204.1 hypothetical protein V172_02850 [Citrobacter freundii RLS1]KFC00579.1 hypothetical protein GCFR_00446 [Citrobacter freundii ATCC 8090 = MTCC 1658 = NBRC 12681]QIH67203.1 hypothetical protein G4551_01350 [Citrobacter freundii ATCC 8090 = MTCC 1658 = NBRC 12681]WOY55331.1 hypothetical protein R6I13_01360 [Citrobacter freundii]
MKKFVPLALLASFSPAFATTVQNLDAVPSAIQHTEGKQIFAEQMAGATPAKGFGELPQGLSENQWIGWVAPNENPNNLILTGAKAWGKEGKYIGIACFADNQADAGQAKKYADNTCPENYNNGRANKLYLGVFSWQNQQLQPIARSEKPLNQISAWNKAAEKESDDESVRPLAYYTKLDLAPYRIAPDTLALGVRGGYSDAYSGGGAFYEVLELYTIKDSKIINVFSDLVYYYSDIAGDWNKDGTRQHDISESKYILKLRSAKTQGFYDLEVVNLQDKSSQIFHWSESLQQYVP